MIARKNKRFITNGKDDKLDQEMYTITLVKSKYEDQRRP